MRGALIMEEVPLHLEFREDGVYISMVSESEPSLKDVVDILKKNGVNNYDGDKINTFLKEKSLEPFKVAEREAEEERDAVVEVQISSDSLTAEIRIFPPSGEKPWPTVEDLKKILEDKGVTFGIKDSALRQVIDSKRVEDWIVVAKGEPAINGKDAEIDFAIQFGQAKPVIADEKDRIDYKNVNSITIVLKNQLLATKTSPTEGKNGMTVRGIPLVAKAGRDRSLPSGKGTVVSEDALSLYSAIDGHLVLANGKLNVVPVFNVEGDVDYSVGNINFIGAVSVKGAVREGFEIVSSGDVDVQGVVEGAYLSSGGNISLSGGVRGMGKAKIEADGDIAANFIDQCTVISKGTVRIKNAILHSDVSANNSVIVQEGSKAQIAGGKVQAGIEVVCLHLGSEMGTKTEVVVGVLPEYNEKRRELQALKGELQEKATKVETNLNFLKKIESAGELDRPKRELLISLTKAKFQVQSQLSKCIQELESVESSIEASRAHGAVRVKGICYPGVSVTIRGVRHIVREEQRFVAFVYEAGEVRIKPYDY